MSLHKLIDTPHGARLGVLRPALPAAIASVAVLLAGCGGSSSGGSVAHLGSSTASSSPSASNAGSSEETQSPAKNQKAMVAYARCMRSHGVASFPEPTEGHIEIKGGGAGGGQLSSSGVNPESAAFQAADKTCRKLLPNGGTPSPQQVAKAQEGALNFSRCMRSHGVPGFPSPKIEGGKTSIRIGGPGTGVDPKSPQFQKAQKTCQSNFGPKGGPGGGSGGDVTAAAP